jgi:hypothetical protein
LSPTTHCRHRRDIAGRGEAEHPAVDGQPGLQGAGDGLRLVEAVPLPGESQTGDGHTAPAKRRREHVADSAVAGTARGVTPRAPLRKPHQGEVPAAFARARMRPGLSAPVRTSLPPCEPAGLPETHSHTARPITPGTREDERYLRVWDCLDDRRARRSVLKAAAWGLQADGFSKRLNLGGSERRPRSQWQSRAPASHRVTQ